MMNVIVWPARNNGLLAVNVKWLQHLTSPNNCA